MEQVADSDLNIKDIKFINEIKSIKSKTFLFEVSDGNSNFRFLYLSYECT